MRRRVGGYQRPTRKTRPAQHERQGILCHPSEGSLPTRSLVLGESETSHTDLTSRVRNVISNKPGSSQARKPLRPAEGSGRHKTGHDTTGTGLPALSLMTLAATKGFLNCVRVACSRGSFASSLTPRLPPGHQLSMAPSPASTNHARELRPYCRDHDDNRRTGAPGGPAP